MMTTYFKYPWFACSLLLVGSALTSACEIGNKDIGADEADTYDDTSDGSDGATAANEPNVCESLEDEPLANSTEKTIVLENVGSEPLFLREVDYSHHDLMYFRIDGVGRVDDLGLPNLRCEIIENDLDYGCGEFGHKEGLERLVRIDPGGSFEFHWDGYVWNNLDIEDCFDEPCSKEDGFGCLAGRIVEPGSLVSVSAVSYSDCTYTGGAECVCPPGESACELLYVAGMTITGELPSATIEFEHDSTPIVLELGG